MCGIAGILDTGSSTPDTVYEQAVQNMLDKMVHRGPDNRGQEKICHSTGTRLFLGHQRLSVIDPSSKGHQPMTNQDSSIWISTNSEIFNFQDLKSQLKSKYEFKSNSDTEVLLKSYEEWGIDCLSKLRGMFAFAIWDGNNNKLILARDRLGIKPLYYFRKNNLLIFSSELRSIKSSNLINTKINPSGIYQYLSYGRVGSEETILEPILELPPANYLISSENNTQRRKYWEPFQSSNVFQPNIPVVEQINELLEEAVSLQLVSDVPLGAFLSGGIDSSAVVGMMTSKSSRAIKTLSVNFSDKSYDESKFSNKIASEYRTSHHEVHLSESNIFEWLGNALYAMDQPTVDGINTYIISQVAHQQELTVALSGLGGDELFAGYDSFHVIPKLNRVKKILDALPSSVRKHLGLMLSLILKGSDKGKKIKHLVTGEISGDHLYFLIRTLFCMEDMNMLFRDPDLLNSEILKNIKNTSKIIESKKNLSLINLISYLEVTQYTAPTLLRDTDFMSMANGLEVRVPLLDHKLVELLFSIPSDMKIKKGQPKILLINALRKKLPDSLINRRKMGFTLPFENWMRGNMKSEVESVLLSPSKKLSDYISHSASKKIWKDFLDKKCSWSRPWALYVLKKWVDINT